jgi:hypothetical protein
MLPLLITLRQSKKSGKHETLFYVVLNFNHSFSVEDQTYVTGTPATCSKKFNAVLKGYTVAISVVVHDDRLDVDSCRVEITTTPNIRPGINDTSLTLMIFTLLNF